MTPPPTETLPFPTTIAERFRAFDAAHPLVYTLFVRFAAEAQAAGKRQWSAKAIVERIRWEYATVLKHPGDFLINNDFTPLYARKLMDERAEFAGFFEIRQRRSA